MTSVNVTTTKNTVTVNGETRVVTVKTAGPQGAQGVLQTGDLGDITVTTTGSGTQSVAINTGVVTSSKILDGTIATGDIADDAITSAKIANAAVTTNEIQNLTIINNDISNSAAIAGTKISPDFGSQNIVTTGQFHSTGSGTSSGLKISNAYDSVFQFFVNNNDNSDFYISYGNSGGPEIKLGHDGKVSLSHAGTTRIQTTTVGASIIGNLGITGTVDGVDIAARDTLFGGLTSSSGVLTDGVTGTTQSASDNSTKIATTSYVDTAVANLVNSAPSTLDTLGEIATELGNQESTATALANNIATKLPLSGGTLTGDLTISTTAPLIKFDESVTNKNYFLVLDDSNLSIRKDSTAGSNIVQRWNSDGHIDFLTNVDFASGIDVTGEITGTSHIDLPSDARLNLGDNDEFFIHHQSSNGNSIIREQGGGVLSLQTNGANITFRDNANQVNMAQFITGGACNFRHGATTRLATTSTGIDVTGNIAVSGTVDSVDLSTYQADGGSYLRSDADDSFTGTLTGVSDTVNPVIQINGSGPNFIRFDSGVNTPSDSIDLIYRTTPNTLAFERVSDSQIMFSVDADDQQAIFNGNVDCNSGLDVTGQIVSESTTGTGSTGLKIANSNESFVQYFEGGGADATFVMSYTGSGGTDIRFKHNGEIQLNFGGQEKFKTTSTGVDVTGNIEVSGSGTFDSGLTVKDASGSDPSMQINHSDADVTGEFLRIGRTDLATRYHSLKAQHGGAATANLLSFHLHDGGSSPFTGQHEVLKLQGNKQVTVAGNLDVGEGVDITGGVTWSAQSNVTGTIDFAADTLATYTPSKTGTGSDTATDAAISLRRGHKIVSQHDGFIRNVLVHHSSHDIHIGQNNTGIVRHIDLLPGSTGSVRLFFDGATNTTPKLTTSANGVDVTGNTTTTQFFGAGTTSPATNFHSFANNTHIGHQIRISQSGAGDAVLGWELTGTRAWSAGIDNSDSNRWKLSSGSSVDSNTQITIEQDGFVGLHHDSGTNPKLKTTSYGITVNDGDSGFTGTYNARVAAVVEGSNSGGTVLNIMSPASGFSGIFFGQPSSAARGQIQYQHNAVSGGTPAETFRFITAGGTETMLMNSTSIDLKEPVNVTGAITSTVSAANTLMLTLMANMGTNNNRPLRFRSPATDDANAPFTIETFNALEVQIDGNKTLNIDASGQINLHHAGSSTAKLFTSATGVGVNGDVVATGDGTFDDIRVGEWAGNTSFGGVLHKNHGGSEYMMINNGSSTSGHTYISATTGMNVVIRGGANNLANQIEVRPTGGINLTAANNVNILDGNISFENSSDLHPYIRMKGNTGSTARVKYAVWNSQTYGMGMTSGMSYGSIGNQIAEGVEFAMTFQMNNSNSRGWIFLDASHTNAQGAMSLTTQGRMTVAHSMRLGYGESDTTESGATHALDVSGSIASTSTITCTSLTETSDIALKENIQPLSNVLDKVKQLTGYKYNFKNKEKASMGVIAQDVEKVFPELVHGEEGEKSLQYSGLVGALVEAIKELSAKVAVLESK